MYMVFIQSMIITIWTAPHIAGKNPPCMLFHAKSEWL